jgi:hypothetical protein
MPAAPGVTFTDNLTDQAPHFVDAEHLNFHLRDDSPAWKMGFQRIPIEKIGLYPGDDRASWPVRHEVRPKPTVPATSMHVSPDERRTWLGPYPIDSMGGAYPATVVHKDGSLPVVYCEEGSGSSVRIRRFELQHDGLKSLE